MCEFLYHSAPDFFVSATDCTVFSQTDIDERMPAQRLREALPSLSDDSSAFPPLAAFEARETYDLLHFRAKACWVRLRECPNSRAMLP